MDVKNRMRIYMNGGSITIAGRDYNNINGEVTIDGDRIYVDGKLVDDCSDLAQFIIRVTGNVKQIETSSGDVTVHGDVGSIKTTSGDVTVEKNVNRGVITVSGDVEVWGGVNGGASTVSGDIINGRK